MHEVDEVGHRQSLLAAAKHDLLVQAPEPLDLGRGQEIDDETKRRRSDAGHGDDAKPAARSFVALIEEQLHATATIPPKQSRVEHRDCDYAAYKERHLVECFIGKLKYFRRVFARFDKYAKRFLSFIHFASMMIWLK